MNIRLTILILVLIPVVVVGGFAATHRPMNATVVALLGAVMIWLANTRYARRIDHDVVQPDTNKAIRLACTWTGWITCPRAATCSWLPLQIHRRRRSHRGADLGR